MLTDAVRELVFAVVMLSILLMASSLVLSVLSPQSRIWPPPGRSSWQFWLTWALSIVIWVGLHVLAVLDWNNFLVPQFLRVLGGILFLAGSTAALRGIRVLGVVNSLGLQGGLVDDGPYRFTRNPQYLADILLLIGGILLANSTLVTVAAALTLLLPLLAPFAEEPWLEAQYGDSYRNYRTRVPRFIGRVRAVRR